LAFEIPRDSRFFLLTFTTPPADSLPDMVQLGEHLFAIKGASPAPLEDHWRTWLGSTETENFDETAFVIAAIKPGVGAAHDAVHRWLDDLAHSLLYGLALLGALRFYEGRAFSLMGQRMGDRVDVQSLSRPFPFYRLPLLNEQEIDEPLLRRALGLSDAIVGLFKLTPQPPITFGRPRPQDHIRVRRGFNALLKGLRAESLNERLHQFVRAMDGVFMTPASEGRKKFRHRGSLFVGGCSEKGAILESMYDLRSAEEHLNDWKSAEPDEETAKLRGTQAELLACQLYAALLENPPLLNTFVSDESTEAFWRRQDHLVRTDMARLLPAHLKVTERELREGGLLRPRW
jgi:hypothetical protein